MAGASSHRYVELRGKKQPITLTKMPFVEQKYYRGP